MINYSLPKTLTVNGKDYKIRWHTEAALDVITALSDPDLSNHDKAIALLSILYEKKVPREDQEEAIKQAIDDVGYDGYCVIESFTPDCVEIAAAASVWRPFAPSPDYLAENGVKFLKSVFG